MHEPISSEQASSTDVAAAYLRGLCGPQDQVIETHFAWVFLLGDLAYKLRKPLQRETMDCRSLEARRLDSIAEVTLNRRLAPDVYLATVPLTRDASGRCAIGGVGELIEWLVQMRRLDRQQFLDERLLAGAVTDEQLTTVARHLATFYQSTAPALRDDTLFAQRLRNQVQANALVLEGYGIDGARALAAAQLVWLDEADAPVRQRAQAGCIVEGHGDLRPEHILLCDPPAVIDCLTFDRNLRVMDRAEELSFLTLECARINQAEAGIRIRNRCLQLLNDPVPHGLLFFYTSHRAATRAKLYAWRVDEPDGGTPQQWRDRAGSYVSDALQAIALARA